jgi:hypothetical protein
MVLSSLECLHWNVGDEDGVILIRNAYGLTRIGEAKQVGERQQVHQAPHLFGDVLQAIKRVFCHGLFLKMLGNNSHRVRCVIRDISGCQRNRNGPQRDIHFCVASANPQQQLRRMALLGGHFMRGQLRWLHVLLYVRIRVVKCVFVVSGCNVIDLLQRVQRARELAQPDAGQNVHNIGVRIIHSGQSGHMAAHVVAHLGGNGLRGIGFGTGGGTKVGKHGLFVMV